MTRASTPVRRLPTGGVVLGAVVVLIGTLALLETPGRYPSSGSVVYTPTLFVLLGILAFVRSRFRSIVGSEDRNVLLDVHP